MAGEDQTHGASATRVPPGTEMPFPTFDRIDDAVIAWGFFDDRVSSLLGDTKAVRYEDIKYCRHHAMRSSNHHHHHHHHES